MYAHALGDAGACRGQANDPVELATLGVAAVGFKEYEQGTSLNRMPSDAPPLVTWGAVPDTGKSSEVV